ncbi:acetyl-CoA carboxylase, carboxyltransferase subunit beta [Candidatus Acetothermia bacterium]|nr:acetyl-CoA carboxylase, carboxyltransferase subunit beta [Candidatus Acetothermia bacterium]MBI3460588.1 acetyl-CoA carboxylase, carboxyltransferase subunit beta [Candidatus Acetothermia bacterium]MBI3660130.1 acetyl-CoA carboxylase, carboxyltransferase subunit beta [Candidatus Acetothermia bacterium]
MAIFKRKYFKLSLDQPTGKDDETLWMKCKACGELVFKKRVRENNNICPKCGEYFFLTAPERIQMLVDPGTFEDISKPIGAADPLDFADQGGVPYLDKVKKAQEETGLSNEIIVGKASLNEVSVILAVMDFRFIGGSMGSVMGEQLCHAMRVAADERRPFILVSSTGGARMQEGILSLMQMAKTLSARQWLEAAGVPFISVMTYPTTGGVQASIANVGDITLAEKGALIGFAGRRVIQQTIKQTLPEDFQTDKFAYEHGFVDRVLKREGLRQELSRILRFFAGISRQRREPMALRILNSGRSHER